MARTTDASAQITVMMGFWNPSHWFSFHPPRVPRRMMASMVKPKPEYRAKKRADSFLVLFLSFDKAWFIV